MVKKKKKDIRLSTWVLHVQTTPNNTMITLTTDKGDKVAGGWTWLVWYKWAKQNTPYAAEMLTKHILKDAEQYGLKELWLVMKGIGMWRDGVFKAINELWSLSILYIKEATWIQFGGCKWFRPKRG